MKKLGFGLMRLPLVNADSSNEIDIKTLEKMVDLYLERGFTYFDTAYILGYIERSDFLRIIEKHGESKILFASDSPWQNIGENVKRLRSFELGAEREDKIFYKNAASLLGMDF